MPVAVGGVDSSCLVFVSADSMALASSKAFIVVELLLGQ